jgi:membrane-bound lytic murein transglycosylase D
MPVIRAAFAAEGVPPELAWIAEAESTLNPDARSPAGARGLFQLMPGTAHALGLSTYLPDDRTNPEKSGRAAARLLRSLFVKFGSWPLALAAYNAGEGRVSRLLASSGASDYAGVASALPSETRMYVPKVCALVAIRTGASIENLRPAAG